LLNEEYGGTIPRLLAAAADRDSEGVWLRSDSGSLTFGGTVAAVGLTAEALSAAGVRRGDLVMMTARNLPPYLICWLALTSLGAVTVAVNPRSTAAELAGLIGQTQPRALITDEGLVALVADEHRPLVLDVGALVPADWSDPAAMAAAARQARLPDAGVVPADPAVLIPTSGTTGRSKLVIQTHRAYAMAGEGFCPCSTSTRPPIP
jgi:acyl-CoA synthetase (AMP-forming)/AMP-acid ligase II